MAEIRVDMQKLASDPQFNRRFVERMGKGGKKGDHDKIPKELMQMMFLAELTAMTLNNIKQFADEQKKQAKLSKERSEENRTDQDRSDADALIAAILKSQILPGERGSPIALIVDFPEGPDAFACNARITYNPV